MTLVISVKKTLHSYSLYLQSNFQYVVILKFYR